MITIPLSTEDLTKVRLAPSPLWETVTSFGVLLHHGRDSAHASWATRTQRTLPGTDLSALVSAMCVKDFSIVDLPEGEQTATIVHRRSMDNVMRIIQSLARRLDANGHRSAD
jgi:hypothetical protein